MRPRCAATIKSANDRAGSRTQMAKAGDGTDRCGARLLSINGAHEAEQQRLAAQTGCANDEHQPARQKAGWMHAQ